MSEISLKEAVIDASVSVLLRGLNPETHRPFTHKETAAILSRAADHAPHILKQHIDALEKKVSLLREYLP